MIPMVIRQRIQRFLPLVGSAEEAADWQRIQATEDRHAAILLHSHLEALYHASCTEGKYHEMYNKKY
ncbi:hypothetical protein GF380_04230 [Candidatus Uhrbacteria bacterium]|nr:hypothetical protein [Candidatus Uhrbacteria bacterium]